MSGVVYFVSDQNGAIKIGTTKDLTSRLQQMQTATQSKLVCVRTIPGGVKVERELHRRLSAFRVRGEWFRDCDEVRNCATPEDTNNDQFRKKNVASDERVNKSIHHDDPIFDLFDLTRLPKAAAALLQARRRHLDARQKLRSIGLDPGPDPDPLQDEEWLKWLVVRTSPTAARGEDRPGDAPDVVRRGEI